MDERQLSSLATGIGLVFGSALGTLSAVVFGAELFSAASYGTGGGIVVGALVGRLVRANRGEDNFRVRAVGGAGTVGLLVGAGVGSVGAWAVDAPLSKGAGLGAGVGLVHGLLVGALLFVTLDRATTE